MRSSGPAPISALVSLTLAVAIVALAFPIEASADENAWGARAEVEPRTDTPSGLPVPRFVSLKFRRTVCRIGPSFAHPTMYTYKRVGLPVRVTAETTDHWRRIEDFEGDTCWAHQTTLIGVNHAVVSRDTDLRDAPRAGAGVRAHLERGVIATLEKAKARKGWRQVSVGGFTGWTPEVALWGAQ